MRSGAKRDSRSDSEEFPAWPKLSSSRAAARSRALTIGSISRISSRNHVVRSRIGIRCGHRGSQFARNSVLRAARRDPAAATATATLDQHILDPILLMMAIHVTSDTTFTSIIHLPHPSPNNVRSTRSGPSHLLASTSRPGLMSGAASTHPSLHLLVSAAAVNRAGAARQHDLSTVLFAQQADLACGS